MDYQLSQRGLIRILQLRDDLTFLKLEDLGNVLHKTVQESNGDVVVDLSEVGHVDSAVTGQFVAAKREADVKRHKFVLAGAPPTVRHVLHTSHADNTIPLYENTEEAIASLADLAHGGDKRRVVPNIKCGHDDCVFFTYVKDFEMVVPACEYPYPEEITNGPNCRCYRVDWKKFQGQIPDSDTPFRSAKKRSLYEVRDRFREETDNRPLESKKNENPRPGSPRSEFGREEERSSANESFEMEPLPDLSEPHDRDQDRAPSSSSELMDPFAQENFPSTAPPSESPSFPSAQPPPSAPPQKPLPEIEEPSPEAELIEEEQAELSPPDRPPPPETPEEVVRYYIQAWNDERYEDEYECLSRKLKTYPKDEYCARRRTFRSTQVARHGKATLQEVGQVEVTAIEGDHARVEITRVDRTSRGSKCYAQTFNLVKEEDGWKIHHSEDGEQRKNPIKPPEKRVQKASDFHGKSRRRTIDPI